MSILDILKNLFLQSVRPLVQLQANHKGDRFPGRNFFHYFMALACVFRLSLWLITTKAGQQKMAALTSLIGFLRTASAGIWIYVTSGDWHKLHEVGMILYLALSIAYHAFLIRLSKTAFPSASTFKSKAMIGIFFLNLAVMMKFFISHKVQKIPGAYSYYAIFEWCLIAIDILMDRFACQQYVESVHIYIQNEDSAKRI